MDNDFGHWLAGLIDGEGTFLIAKHKGRNKEGRPLFNPLMLVRLRNDDHDVLAQVQKITGIGTLNTYSTKTSPQSAWQVASKTDVRKLVSILDDHPLRTKKKRDYEIWKRAVDAYLRDGGLSPHLAQLKSDLEAVRKHPSAGGLKGSE